MERTKMEFEADKLRALFADKNYQDTIGKWIDLTRERATYDMAFAEDPKSRMMARAKYQVIAELDRCVKAVLLQAERDLEKRRPKVP